MWGWRRILASLVVCILKLKSQFLVLLIIPVKSTFSLIKNSTCDLKTHILTPFLLWIGIMNCGFWILDLHAVQTLTEEKNIIIFVLVSLYFWLLWLLCWCRIDLIWFTKSEKLLPLIILALITPACFKENHCVVKGTRCCSKNNNLCCKAWWLTRINRKTLSDAIKWKPFVWTSSTIVHPEDSSFNPVEACMIAGGEWFFVIASLLFYCHVHWVSLGFVISNLSFHNPKICCISTKNF